MSTPASANPFTDLRPDEPRLQLVHDTDPQHPADARGTALCRAELEVPCERLARPGRSNGLCNAHRVQSDRGKPMTPLPPYRRRAIGLSKDCMAVLEDLRAHEPRRPYDRAKAAERLGWASRKVGTVLRKLVELGRIRPLPKQVREMTDKHPIWESLRYEILD